MVGWLGAAGLAFVGGLKGQGNPWRQLPFFSFLAATAIFISWRVRRNSDKDVPKLSKSEDEKSVEGKTREYLVYDEKEKLELASSSCLKPSKSSGRPKKILQDEQNPLTPVQNGAGKKGLAPTEDAKDDLIMIKEVQISNDDIINDTASIAACESCAGKVRTFKLPVTTFSLPQPKNRPSYRLPEAPVLDELMWPCEYDLVPDDLIIGTKNAQPCSAEVGVLEGRNFGSIPNLTLNTRSEGQLSAAPVRDDRKEPKTTNSVDKAETMLSTIPGKDDTGMLQVREGKVGGMRISKKTAHRRTQSEESDFIAEPVSSATLKIDRDWKPPKLDVNQWMSSEGVAEVEEERLAHPNVVGDKYFSPVAESIREAYTLSNLSTSDSCGSDLVESKDECSPENEFKRKISPVDDMGSGVMQDESAIRIRTYEEYLADPSLSPTMRSQVSRAKATLERLLYDSD